MKRAEIEAYLDENFPRHLEAVRAFVRQPSISFTGEGIRETAEMIVGLIEARGGSARLVPTPGHPVVMGEIDGGAPVTLLVYGMYDVMPADEPGWSVPPFGGEIRDVPGLGKCLINRGAVNTKGPLGAFFNAVEAIQAVEGKLPVNLLFAIEGEEEMGSRHFPDFVRAHKAELSRAEAVLFPFFEQEKDGTPVLTLGTKGICYFELVAKGGDWGGPVSRGVHGSQAAWLNNPAWRLVHALACLVDGKENIRVEGFYDRVRGVADEDMALLRELGDALDERQQLRMYDARRFKYDLRGPDLWAKLFFTPTLNIDGLVSGYTGPGTKTLLPHEAVAKVDIRMVPDMDPQEVARTVRAHLDRHGFQDVEMRVLNNYKWSKVSVQEPCVQAMLDSYRDFGTRPQCWPMNPGSAPYWVFQDILGIPYVTGGMGHGSRQHSSDEYCTVDGILAFEKSMVAFFEHYLRRRGA